MINLHTSNTTTNKCVFGGCVAVFFTLECRFPHIAGPLYKLELEVRQARRLFTGGA